MWKRRIKQRPKIWRPCPFTRNLLSSTFDSQHQLGQNQQTTLVLHSLSLDGEKLKFGELSALAPVHICRFSVGRFGRNPPDEKRWFCFVLTSRGKDQIRKFFFGFVSHRIGCEFTIQCAFGFRPLRRNLWPCGYTWQTTMLAATCAPR